MIVWVADSFADELLGGAELTSQALMQACPEPVVKLSTRDISDADVDRYGGATWVVENIAGVPGAPARAAALRRVLATQRFFRLEYDYNWCRARSPVCHRVLLGGDCDCVTDRARPLGRFYELLHGRAQHVFYMSLKQLLVHRQYLGSLMTPRASVLGSCFSDATLERIMTLGKTMTGREWLVVSRWSQAHDFFKGAYSALGLARELGLPVKVTGGIAYDAFLTEMARSIGLIYLPNDLDPSPRTVIEAKLMGRRLILNENVLHKDEPWFRDASPEGVAEYLRGLPANFWRTVGA